jgi:outer membrane protein assembly factor BamA
MRALILLTAMVAVGAWVVIHQLPEREAHADAGPMIERNQIQAIAIDGGRRLPISALRAVVSTKVGDLVDGRRLEADRAAIEAELAALGYLAAKVASPTVTHGVRGGAYVVFDVEKGPMFHLRSVTVTGPGQRDADVVKLSAGDEATRERITRARQALADTIARRGGKRVELLEVTDVAAAAVDLELATK